MLTKFLPFFAVIFSLGVNMLLAWIAWSLRQMAKDEVARAMTAMNGVVAACEQRLAAKDAEIAEKVEEQADLLHDLQGKIASFPTREDFEKLAGKVEEVGRTVAGQSSKLEGVKESNVAAQASVDRLYQYLLTNTRQS